MPLTPLFRTTLVFLILLPLCAQTPPPTTPATPMPPPAAAPTAAPEDVTAISNLFAKDQNALTQKDAGTLVQSYDKAVLAWFDQQKVLASSAHPQANPNSKTPQLDNLVISALVTKVPPDQRANVNLQDVMQRLLNANLIKPENVQTMSLDSIAAQGDHATAALHYKNTTIPLSLVKEDGQWKFNLTSAFSYFELLLQMDSIMKGETPQQQTDRLVQKIPAWQ